MNVTYLNQYTLLSNPNAGRNKITISYANGSMDTKGKPKGLTETQTLEAWIGESAFEMSTFNKYDSIMGMDNDGFMSTINKFMIGAVGMSFQSSNGQAPIWNKSDVPEYKFKLIFVAEDNAKTEVWDKVRLLESLCAPTTWASSTDMNTIYQDLARAVNTIPLLGKNLGKWFFGYEPTKDGKEMQASTGDATRFNLKNIWNDLLAPPNLGGASGRADQGKLISISLGNFITLNNMIIEGCSIDMDMKNQSPDGYPLYAEATISVSSQVIWTNKVIDQIRANGHPDDRQIVQTGLATTAINALKKTIGAEGLSANNPYKKD